MLRSLALQYEFNFTTSLSATQGRADSAWTRTNHIGSQEYFKAARFLRHNLIFFLSVLAQKVTNGPAENSIHATAWQ